MLFLAILESQQSFTGCSQKNNNNQDTEPAAGRRSTSPTPTCSSSWGRSSCHPASLDRHLRSTLQKSNAGLATFALMVRVHRNKDGCHSHGGHSQKKGCAHISQQTPLHRYLLGKSSGTEHLWHGSGGHFQGTYISPTNLTKT